MRIFFINIDNKTESVYNCILPEEDFTNEDAIAALKQIEKYNQERQYELAEEGIMLGGFERINGTEVEITRIPVYDTYDHMKAKLKLEMAYRGYFTLFDKLTNVEIKEILASFYDKRNSKLVPVKMLRTYTGLGLKECLMIVNEIWQLK